MPRKKKATTSPKSTSSVNLKEIVNQKMEDKTQPAAKKPKIQAVKKDWESLSKVFLEVKVKEVLPWMKDGKPIELSTKDSFYQALTVTSWKMFDRLILDNTDTIGQ
jgi:hypothetical protein